MEHCDVLIVGAGPAGLAAAASLTQRRVPFVLIEAQQNVGASWRRHYDRLCLHTTKKHSTPPGLLFPRNVGTYPSRAQVIDYLEAYSAHFRINTRFGERLERARPCSDAAGDAPEARWDIQTSSQHYRARRLIVAAGLNRTPVRPTWPRQELFRGPVLHSAEYKSGARFSGQRRRTGQPLRF